MSTHNFEVTVMIPSFRTYRSGQTVQTQITLLLEEQSSLFAIPSASFWRHFSSVRPVCLNFWVITAIFWLSKNLGVLW